MNVEEVWHQWKPIQGLELKYEFESITWDCGALLIIMYSSRDPKNKIKIDCGAIVESYQFTQETHCIETIIFLNKKYGSDFYSKWTLFRRENSFYIDRLRKASVGIADTMDLQHFSCITGEGILDIINEREPVVSIFYDE